MKKLILFTCILLAAMLVFVSCDQQAKTVTLSYDANGGSGAPAAQTGAAGTGFQVASAEGMTWTGHSFLGWNTRKDGTGTAYKPGDTVKPSADMKLYARWDETATVTFSPNGATGSIPEPSIVVSKGSKITMPESTGMSFEHYDFDSWNTVADGTGTEYKPGDEVKINGNTTFYARWKNHVYQVSFDSNGGEGEIQPLSAFYGNVVSIPENSFTKEDGVFEEWNTSADKAGTTIEPGPYTVTGNVTLYAIWKTGTPVYTEEDLDFETGGEYWLANDIELTSAKTVMIDTYVDLAGYTLSSENSLTVAPGVSSVFLNGDLEFLTVAVGEGTASDPGAGLFLYDCSLSTTGPVMIDMIGKEGMLMLDNCELVGEGRYGVRADEAFARENSLAIMDSTILTDAGDNNSTALLVSAPDSAIYLSGSSFAGDRQGAIIRSGDLVAEDSTFVTTGAFEGAPRGGQGWETGNNVPEAALVLGDDIKLEVSVYTNSDKTMGVFLKDCLFLATGAVEGDVWVESNQDETLTVEIEDEDFDMSLLSVLAGRVTINGKHPLVGKWTADTGYAEFGFDIKEDKTAVISFQTETMSSTMYVSEYRDDAHGFVVMDYSETSVGTVSVTYDTTDTLTIMSLDILADTYQRPHAEGLAGEWTCGTTRLTLTKTGQDETSATYSFVLDHEIGENVSGSITVDGTDCIYTIDEITDETPFEVVNGNVSIAGIPVTKV